MCLTVTVVASCIIEALRVCALRRNLRVAGSRMRRYYPLTVPWKMVQAAWKALGSGDPDQATAFIR